MIPQFEDAAPKFFAHIVVDAMVLSGCRICSNLTNDNKHFKGGTRRQCKRTKERKAGESKANAGGSRYAPQRLSRSKWGQVRMALR
jgi:hypothetical protein